MPAAKSSGSAPGRPGITSAFRGAYRAPNVREDIGLLPTLLRGRWFLVSLALVLLGFAAPVILPTTVTLFAFQTLTLPPAMVPIFLVGFTAPRASYLLGLILGVIDVVLYSVYIVVIAGSVAGQSLSIGDYLVSGASIGIPASIVFASAAAWYKRFLSLSSPRRQAPSGRAKSGAKAAARR